MAAADEFFAKASKQGGSPKGASADLQQKSQLEFDIDFYDSVLQRAPGYLDVLRCQGELLSRKGWHERALAIDLRLAELLPADCVVQYNLACSLTMTNRFDEALAALRRALEAGYDDFQHLRTDCDLDRLRQAPGYQTLLDEFEPEI